jgi:hypothetical protein
MLLKADILVTGNEVRFGPEADIICGRRNVHLSS